MRLVCLTVILLASLGAGALPAHGSAIGSATGLATGSAWAQTNDQRAALERAAWAFVYWSEAVRAEAAGLGLPAPAVQTRYRPEAEAAGALNLLGTAEAGAVTILLEGSGWQRESASARRLLARNAAHEAAHLYQHAQGLPSEPQWLHEGFADAMAFAALDARGEASGWAGGQRCAGALRRGRLRARFAADDADALYDCGSVAIRAVAAARGESPRALYDAFVAGGRDEPAFLTLAGEAGPEWRRSVRAFLARDWTNSDPLWVIRSLRSGAL